MHQATPIWTGDASVGSTIAQPAPPRHRRPHGACGKTISFLLPPVGPCTLQTARGVQRHAATHIGVMLPPPSAAVPPAPTRTLTPRALCAGLVVGAVLCFSNTYFGLQTGWVTMGSLQAAILGEAALYFGGSVWWTVTVAASMLPRVNAGAAAAPPPLLALALAAAVMATLLPARFARPPACAAIRVVCTHPPPPPTHAAHTATGYGLFQALEATGLVAAAAPLTVGENVIVQTTAVATATMPLAAGLVGIVPALGLLRPEDNPPLGAIRLSTPALLAWCSALAFFGVFVAVPLRAQVILRERLRFPSGTATASVIRTLHGAPAVAGMKQLLQPAQQDGAYMREQERQRAQWGRALRLLLWCFAASGAYSTAAAWVKPLRCGVSQQLVLLCSCSHSICCSCTGALRQSPFSGF